jgi:adenylosuccinate synthase
MSLWVVVGGQYGSEGKGKISAYIAQRENIDICIRCGGPNSGHSFIDQEGNHHLVRQVPTGFINSRTRLMIPAGGLIDLDVLKAEIDLLKLTPDRLAIDRNCMVIEERDREAERALHLQERLSSTLCGVGSAVSRRALRGSDVKLAGQASAHIHWLGDYLADVSSEANKAIDRGRKVLVEGTQGFGLSLYHSEHYPKTTSRDTTAAGFLSEVGLSPRLVTEIVVVFRTFPIRVAGKQAGPLENEISWEELQEESGYRYPIQEFTSVTQKLRRVARFDWALADKAVKANRPTKIAINGLDYLNFSNKGVQDSALLDYRAQMFVEKIVSELGIFSFALGTGPRLQDIVAFNDQSLLAEPCILTPGLQRANNE